MNILKNSGRNVINIEQVKQKLSHYADEKNLSLSVRFWLQKTFLRWLINYYPHIQEVRTVERYKTLVKGKVPLWFTPEDEKKIFIYIEIQHHKFQELLEKCSEFLSSRDVVIEHKFPRMTVEHVLKKWEDEHILLTKKEKIYKETSGEGLEKVFVYKDLYFVKFKDMHRELSLEMARESALMQHCLGEFENDEKGEGGYGAYYFDLIKKREIELYSLRDQKNMPHATIALNQKDGTFWLDQIKGKQNIAPIERYIPACISFFNHFNVQYNYHSDTLCMGVVYINGVSQRVEEIKEERIQQFLVAYDSHFIKLLPHPSKSTKWLATLREPSSIEQINQPTESMKIIALLQQTILMLQIKSVFNISPKEILKSVQKYEIKGRIFRFVKLQVGRV